MLLLPYRPDGHPSRNDRHFRTMRDTIFYDPEGRRHQVTLAADFDTSRYVLLFRADDDWLGFTRVSEKLSLRDARYDDLVRWLEEARAS